jgi:hypothetical protein
VGAGEADALEPASDLGSDGQGSGGMPVCARLAVRLIAGHELPQGAAPVRAGQLLLPGVARRARGSEARRQGCGVAASA